MYASVDCFAVSYPMLILVRFNFSLLLYSKFLDMVCTVIDVFCNMLLRFSLLSCFLLSALT